VAWTAQGRAVVSSPTPRGREGRGEKEIWKRWGSESANAGLGSTICVVGLLGRCEGNADVGGLCPSDS